MRESTSKVIAETKTLNAWEINGNVYFARKYSTIDTKGNPTAARWECNLNHWNLYRETAYAMFTDI